MITARLGRGLKVIASRVFRTPKESVDTHKTASPQKGEADLALLPSSLPFRTAQDSLHTSGLAGQLFIGEPLA
jgi:hypothetical protein